MLIGEPEQIMALQTKYASMRVEYARVLEENARLTEEAARLIPRREAVLAELADARALHTEAERESVCLRLENARMIEENARIEEELAATRVRLNQRRTLSDTNRAERNSARAELARFKKIHTGKSC